MHMYYTQKSSTIIAFTMIVGSYLLKGCKGKKDCVLGRGKNC